MLSNEIKQFKNDVINVLTREFNRIHSVADLLEFALSLNPDDLKSFQVFKELDNGNI